LEVATHPTDLAEFRIVARRALEHGSIVDSVERGWEE
jgi:hypothetical protein